MDNQIKTKFCKHCGKKIAEDAVVCVKCGRQVEELKRSTSEQIIINNNNNASSSSSASASASATAANMANNFRAVPKNKWVSLLLCIFTFCGHKFYEGKVGMGVLYFFTFGLFGIGWFIYIISISLKPNPYYVYLTY